MSDNSGDFQRRTWRADDPSRPATDPTRGDDVGVDTRTWDAAHMETGPRPPMMWLVVAYPLQHRGIILVVEPGQVIGRKGEIYWRDPRMSRRHARFDLIRGYDDTLAYAVLPENSRNGTYVNGRMIEEVTVLQENDRIQMGDTLFVVKTLE